MKDINYVYRGEGRDIREKSEKFWWGWVALRRWKSFGFFKFYFEAN